MKQFGQTPLLILTIFFRAAAIDVAAFANTYTSGRWRQLDPFQQMAFIMGAEDCRYTWAPERFPGSNLTISGAFNARLQRNFNAGRYPDDLDMLDVLDDLDRHFVHVTVKPDFPEDPLQYQPHGQNWGIFWTDLGSGSGLYIEGYLACRVRYFHQMTRRSINDCRRLIDDWFGKPNSHHTHDRRGRYLGVKPIPAARALAPVGDILDRILAADDAAAVAATLRPAQRP